MRIHLTLLACAIPTMAHAQLTIRVTSVPASTPPSATVYVAGTFNQWNPGEGAYALHKDGDRSYTITLPDSVRGPIEFKFTLGSWERSEIAAKGGGVANRIVTIPAGGVTTYTTQIGGWQTGKPPVRHSTRTPEVSVLSDSFAIPQLHRSRRVWVYLPPGYATSTRRYPVLYMHDGQNVFDASTSFTGEWGVDEALDSLHAHGGPDAIVVAVDHGGTHRLDEYDPWRNANSRYGGGEGEQYVSFLIHTLKPYVDAHYRTLRDPAHTGIMGSSMGGLISLVATLEHPDVFGRAGVFSCACWIADPHVYQLARTSRPSRPPARFYFVAGGQETPDGSQGRDQTRVVDSLRAAGFPASAVRASVPADGKHSEWFWRREFPAAFVWLFGSPR